MPLPGSNIGRWPPLDLLDYHRQQERWAAWWSGDKYELRRLATEFAIETQDETGRRSFWHRRDVKDKTRGTKHLHAALASDIASASADFLFGEPPSLRVENNDAAQNRLEELAEALGLWNLLLEAGEACAAMGSVWLRPVWDTTVADHPLLTIVHADQAAPDFRFRQLRAVTFWEEVHREPDVGPLGTTSRGMQVWRHLERHEPGVILHGLYIGSEDDLGVRVSLQDHPSTEGFEDVVEVPSGVPGLLPKYVPNALPNRRYRRLPIGRSDYAEAEDELDSLDEAWSSWMRDLRLGQARILAPKEFLQEAGTGKRGEGRTLDLDTELFTGLEIADLERVNDPIKEVQFDIRVEEHERTCMALVERIVSQAGYSPQTFGLHIEGRAESGTALKLRESKTFRTQGRKQRYWKPAIVGVARDLLALDRAVFGRDTPVEEPTLEWAELEDNPLDKANWINLLRAAQVMSRRTGIRLAQPQLSDQEVDEELRRIEEEHTVDVGNPLDGSAP